MILKTHCFHLNQVLSLSKKNPLKRIVAYLKIILKFHIMKPTGIENKFTKYIALRTFETYAKQTKQFCNI